MDRYASYLYQRHYLIDSLSRQGYQLYSNDRRDGSKLPRLDIPVPNDLHYDVSCRLQIRLNNQDGGAYSRFEHNCLDNSDNRTRFMDMLLDHGRCPLLRALLR